MAFKEQRDNLYFTQRLRVLSQLLILHINFWFVGYQRIVFLSIGYDWMTMAMRGLRLVLVMMMLLMLAVNAISMESPARMMCWRNSHVFVIFLYADLNAVFDIVSD